MTDICMLARPPISSPEFQVLDYMPAHIALLDQTGTILRVNEAWRRFAKANGLEDPNACVGQNYLETCQKAESSNPTARQVAAGIAAVIHGTADYFEFEYPCHSPEEKRFFLMTISRVTGNHAYRFVMCHHNITARVLAEQNSINALRRMKEAYAHITHDIRNPLTSIKAALSLVNNDVCGDISEKAKECTLIAEQSAAQLIELSTEFLDLQRDLQNFENIVVSPVEVSELLEEAALLMSGLAKQRNMSVDIDCIRAQVVCDKRSIVRVLVNLLSNAIKFTPSSGHVRLIASSANENVTFAVADEGPGIPKERLSDLFKPFGFSGQSSVKGSGLGLSAVKEMLALNGAEPAVYSSDAGTTISFQLPRAAKDPR